MLHFSKKKKNKLNSYKAVRENIQLNKSGNLPSELNNVINYENIVFQMAEVNLVNHLSNQKKGLPSKLVVKWWEN